MEHSFECVVVHNLLQIRTKYDPVVVIKSEQSLVEGRIMQGVETQSVPHRGLILFIALLPGLNMAGPKDAFASDACYAALFIEVGDNPDSEDILIDSGPSDVFPLVSRFRFLHRRLDESLIVQVYFPKVIEFFASSVTDPVTDLVC